MALKTQKICSEELSCYIHSIISIFLVNSSSNIVRWQLLGGRASRMHASSSTIISNSELHNHDLNNSCSRINVIIQHGVRSCMKNDIEYSVEMFSSCICPFRNLAVITPIKIFSILTIFWESIFLHSFTHFFLCMLPPVTLCPFAYSSCCEFWILQEPFFTMCQYQLQLSDAE